MAIPARSGKGIRLPQGGRVKVINTHGTQVVDTWMFNADDLNEFQSNEHTRPCLMNLTPRQGDALYTNKRRPIMTIEEDTSPGTHDTLMAACDNYRYQLLGCTEYHDNCTDNLTAAMAQLGLKEPETPCPLNLFMNIPWTGSGELAWQAPASKPGDYVVLRAEMSCIVMFSACPQDILPINGIARAPTEAHIEVY